MTDAVRYPTEATCLTMREEVASLAHVIDIAGLSPSVEAYDVALPDAERGALSTLQKVLDLLDAHALGDGAR